MEILEILIVVLGIIYYSSGLLWCLHSFKLNGILHYPGIKIVIDDESLKVDTPSVKKFEIKDFGIVNCENIIGIHPDGSIGIG